MHGLSTRQAAPRATAARASRLGALAITTMALLILVELATGSPPVYLAVLGGSVAAGSTITGTLMWRRDSFDSQLGAVVLAVLTLAGQVIISSVGAPGTSDAQWSPLAVAISVLAATVPALVAAASQVRPLRVEHPYAL